jgi:hypothetical protein
MAEDLAKFTSLDFSLSAQRLLLLRDLLEQKETFRDENLYF